MFAIEINQIHKSYAKILALNNISLTIKEGEFFGLLGPNGAGKTTLINIIAGLSKANKGYVNVYKYNVVTDFCKARRMLGVVPQELIFDPFFTVREILCIHSGYYGIRNNNDWIDEILFHLGLTEYANTNTRSLSGGMKRRMLIAQALVHRPPVIILDEPTAGVDLKLRKTLWCFISRLNKEGHTIILTTHYLEEAQTLCNRIAIMCHGKIISLNETNKLLKSFANLKLYLILVTNGKLPKTLMKLVVRNEKDNMNVNQSLFNNSYTLRLNSYEDIRSILCLCYDSGCKIEDIKIKKTNLEDIFLLLTSKSN